MAETSRTRKTGRGAAEGIGAGLIAGVIFAAAEIVGSAVMGNPPLMPLRAFASVVLGESALQTASLGTAVVVGVVAHLVLSAIFGVIYGLLNSTFSSKTETSFGRQAGLGLLFGAVLWIVNFQIIARILYPWFLGMPQLYQVLMHAIFFGLPVAFVYAAAERRVQLARPAHPRI